MNEEWMEVEEHIKKVLEEAEEFERQLEERKRRYNVS